MPALFNLRCVLGPVGVLPNMNLIEKLADHANIDIWSMVPSLVDELGDTPDVLVKFCNSKFICASGGQSSSRLYSQVFCTDVQLVKRTCESRSRLESERSSSSIKSHWHNRRTLHRQSGSQKTRLALVCFPSVLRLRVQRNRTRSLRALDPP